MPYKTGKMKGELTTPEIRKLIKAHNVLVSITIPKGSKREDIIALVKKNGYEVNHEKQALVPKVEMKRKPKVDMKSADKVLPKPKTKEEKVEAKKSRDMKKKEKDDKIKAEGVKQGAALQRVISKRKVKKVEPKKVEPKIDKKQIDKLSLEYIKEIKKMSPLKTLAEIQSTFKKYEKKIYDFIGTNVDNYEELRKYWDDNWLDKISEAIPDGRKKEAPKKKVEPLIISKIKDSNAKLYDYNFTKEKDIVKWFNSWKRDRRNLNIELKEALSEGRVTKKDLKPIEPVNIKRTKKYKIREGQIFRAIKNANK